MDRVVLESPYAGMVEANVEYARMAVRDSLGRGEAPIASHLLYTQEGILDDTTQEERDWGINAGLEWLDVCTRQVVYCDLGVSSGMRFAIAAAKAKGVITEYRWIG